MVSFDEVMLIEVRALKGVKSILESNTRDMLNGNTGTTQTSILRNIKKNDHTLAYHVINVI